MRRVRHLFAVAFVVGSAFGCAQQQDESVTLNYGQEEGKEDSVSGKHVTITVWGSDAIGATEKGDTGSVLFVDDRNLRVGVHAIDLSPGQSVLSAQVETAGSWREQIYTPGFALRYRPAGSQAAWQALTARVRLWTLLGGTRTYRSVFFDHITIDPVLGKAQFKAYLAGDSFSGITDVDGEMSLPWDSGADMEYQVLVVPMWDPGSFDSSYSYRVTANCDNAVCN